MRREVRPQVAATLRVPLLRYAVSGKILTKNFSRPPLSTIIVERNNDQLASW